MNPFVFSKVVRGEHFYNREKELNEIVSTIKGGNNIVLYAPRRYGKTSLVLKALEELQSQGYKTVYFDFMMVYSKSSFINNYAKALFKTNTNFTKFFQNVSEFLKSIKPILSFDENQKPNLSIDFQNSKVNDSLEEIIDLPENLAKAKKEKYVIVFDEFQELEKLNGDNFEKLIRSKIQHQENTYYIFLGSKTSILKEMFLNRSRAFYNSSKAISINKMPESESINFLIDRFRNQKIVLKEEDARYMINKVENIPYYIQMLASQIWIRIQEKQKQINKNLIDDSINEIINLKRDYYVTLFDGLNYNEKKLLKGILNQNSGFYTIEFLEKYDIKSQTSVTSSLNSLLRKGLIEKSNGDYYLLDPIFRVFLNNSI